MLVLCCREGAGGEGQESGRKREQVRARERAGAREGGVGGWGAENKEWGTLLSDHSVHGTGNFLSFQPEVKQFLEFFCELPVRLDSNLTSSLSRLWYSQSSWLCPQMEAPPQSLHCKLATHQGSRDAVPATHLTLAGNRRRGLVAAERQKGFLCLFRVVAYF